MSQGMPRRFSTCLLAITRLSSRACAAKSENGRRNNHAKAGRDHLYLLGERRQNALPRKAKRQALMKLAREEP